MFVYVGNDRLVWRHIGGSRICSILPPFMSSYSAMRRVFFLGTPSSAMRSTDVIAYAPGFSAGSRILGSSCLLYICFFFRSDSLLRRHLIWFFFMCLCLLIFFIPT
jgi:hypothetical protein